MLHQMMQTDHVESKEDYKKQIKQLQFRLLNLQQTIRDNQIGLIVVFEGMDAAGKGGAIKRLTESMDPRGFVVHPIAAPREHELRYHYLQRFWRKLPQHGQIGIFDRSWYGRVLVERVEQFATPAEWQRAYEELNNFEKLLTDESYIVMKHWIHVSKDEQLKRFEERQNNPFKQWKLTDEDWRNRGKWDEYIQAAEEMLQKTHTNDAPWFVVSGDDKHSARIQVLKNIVQEIESNLVNKGISIP